MVELGAKTEPRAWHGAKSSPHLVGRLEETIDKFSRSGVSLRCDHAAINISDFSFPLDGLADQGQHTLRHVGWQKAGHDAGNIEVLDQELEELPTRDHRHVTGQQKAVDVEVGVVDQHPHHLRHGLVPRQ